MLVCFGVCAFVCLGVCECLSAGECVSVCLCVRVGVNVCACVCVGFGGGSSSRRVSGGMKVESDFHLCSLIVCVIPN